MTTATSIQQAIAGRVRGEVYTDLTMRGLYATDASHYQMIPACVVVVRDEADVTAVVAVARERNLQIIGRGGGTSLAGQTFGTGIVLDFSKYMHAVLEVDEAGRWARVQPGIVRDALNRALRPRKLHFAPDPATTSRATVGGMIANNSSGTRSIVYGKTIDNVLELRVLLSDGTICTLAACDAAAWRARSAGLGREAELYRGVGQIIAAHHTEMSLRFPKVMRRVSGYNLDAFPGTGPVPAGDGPEWNLSNLICGSEGTLGLVLEATVKLVPLPGATALCIVHFTDLIESLRHVPTMLAHHPSTVELLDDTIIDEARVNPACRDYVDFFEGEPTAVQIVEFMGDTQAEADARVRDFADDMRSRGIGYAHVLRHDLTGINHVWELRRLGVGLQSNVRGRKKPLDFVDDACVPVEHLADYIEQLRDICTRHGVRMPVSAHSSVGVLHAKPMLDLHDPDDVGKMRAIAEEAFVLVKAYGGSWAGEHGDGLVRGEFVQPFFGDALYGAFRQVKRLFDPLGLMNPGKIIDTPAMTENLRHAPPGYQQQTDAVHSNYHYRNQDGFALAVEQCTGLGVCRKVDVGSMCPSYMATRDEEASTRGRANALRLAMSGQLGTEGLAGDGVAEALELCLECKACKRECPNAVDMARLKSDVLQMRHDARGTPLGHRLMGDSPGAARLFAGPLAPLVNWAQETAVFRAMLEKVAGVDRRRTLPHYARKRFGGGRPRPSGRGASRLGPVVLFNDTYVNCYEPHVGVAAVELLESCGYEVIVADAGCCQRPRMSKGLVRAARRDGEKTLGKLDVFVREGLTIVCTEPSCCSALNDDLPDLIEDAALGQRVAGAVKMIDVFLGEELAAGRLDRPFTSPVKNILLHGHCHQTALFGTTGMKQILGRVEGLVCTEVDSGCCGMAGSFGYEHHDVSMTIGEQRLFPAVRTAMADDAAVAICANGFSCRHQVHYGCGVMPKHWVELVRAE